MLDNNKVTLTIPEFNIWMEYKKNPKNKAYNTLFLFKIYGKLKRQHLINSINYLFQKYPILRCCFIEENNIPYKIIREKIDFKLKEFKENNKIDFKKSSNLIISYLNNLYNLNTDVLLRCAISKLSEKDYIIGIGFHHIIIDAHAVKLIFHDLEKVYHFKNSYNNKILTNLYSNILYKSNGTKISYWKKQISNSNLVVELPINNIKKKLKLDGYRFTFRINKSQSNLIFNFLSKHNITLFILIVAIIKVILFRITKQKDITILYLSANRNKDNFFDIGCYANNLLLRSLINPEEKLIDLLLKIKTVRYSNQKNQQISLLEIIKSFKNDKDSPFKDGSLPNIWINSPTSNDFKLNLSGLLTEIVLIKKNFKVQNDLTLNYSIINGEICIEFEFNINKLDKFFIKNLSNSVEVVLCNINDNSNKYIKDISLSSLASIKAFYKEKVNINPEIQIKGNIGKFVENICKKYADKVAIKTSSGQQIHYSLLNKKINECIIFLKNNINLKSGDRVAINLKNSLESTIIFLAIIKCNSVYIPITNKLSDSELVNIINDCAVNYIITDQQYSYVLKHSNYIKSIKNYLFATKKLSIFFLKNTTRFYFKKDVCCIMHTSGTTGNPKGVIISHKSFFLRLLGIISTYNITIDTVYLNHTPNTFDAFFEEVLVPLITGASIVIFDQGYIINNFNYLCSIIKKYNVNTISFVPSILELFLEASKIKFCSNLKKIISGGEKLKYQTVLKLYKLFPNIELINTYGPTEANIIATSFKCNKYLFYDPPIGKPLPNTNIYILDQYSNFTPLGCVGEIYIGGNTISEGYSLEQLNENKFFKPKSLNPNINEIVYKTGDLGLLDKSGNICYVGRIDRQLKLYGVRIEPEKIESALNTHYNIINSAVININCTNHKNNLVAFIKLKKRNDNYSKDIQKYLFDKLPIYMIPAHFIDINFFPINVHGKIDYKTLNTLYYEKFSNIKNIACITNKKHTLNSTEQQVCKILSSIFRRDINNLNNSFLELGGDSLDALKFIFETESIGLNIDFHSIYKASSIKELISSKKTQLGRLEIFQLNNCTNNIVQDNFIPISYQQQELIEKKNKLHHDRFFNNVLTYQLKGKLNFKALKFAIINIIKTNDIFRTKFKNKNHQVYQHILKYNKEASFIREVKAKDQNEIRKFINNLLNKPVDISNDNLIKFFVIKLDSITNYFVIFLHHIIFDGWSINIILKNINLYYKNYLEGDLNVNLSDSSISYAQFCLLQYQKLSSINNSNQNFKKYLNYNVFLLSTHGVNKCINFTPSIVQFFINNQDSEEINKFAKKHKLLHSSIFLASLKLFLYKIFRQDWLSVNFPVTDRPSIKLQNTIGYFVDNFFITSKIYSDITIVNFFKQVDQNVKGILGKKTLPSYFIKKINKSLNSPNITFIYQNSIDQDLKLKDIKSNYINFSHNFILDDIEMEVFYHSIINKFLLSFTYKKNLLNKKQIISDYMNIIYSFINNEYTFIHNL